MPFHKLAESKAYRHSFEFIVSSVGGFFHFFLKMALNKTSNRHSLVSKYICENLYCPLRGVSELMDGWGCAILGLELVPKNLIFT